MHPRIKKKYYRKPFVGRNQSSSQFQCGPENSFWCCCRSIITWRHMHQLSRKGEKYCTQNFSKCFPFLRKAVTFGCFRRYGKTFAVNLIHNIPEAKGKSVIAVDMSAVTAQLLCKSSTERSTFRISIPCKTNSNCHFVVSSIVASWLTGTDLIIRDEVMKCMSSNIEPVDRTPKCSMHSKMFFEGKAKLFLTYFRHILHVVTRGFRAIDFASCFKKISLMPLLEAFHLTTNIWLCALQQNSYSDEKVLAFPKLLSDVRKKTLAEPEDHQIELPTSLNRKNTVSNLCSAVFPRTDRNYKNTKCQMPRAIRTFKNRFLSDTSETVMKSVPRKTQDNLRSDTEKTNTRIQWSLSIVSRLRQLFQITRWRSRMSLLWCCFIMLILPKNTWMARDALWYTWRQTNYILLWIQGRKPIPSFVYRVCCVIPVSISFLFNISYRHIFRFLCASE